MNSLSTERLLIKGTINNKEAIFLVDTGATVGLIDEKCSKEYGLSNLRKYTGLIVSASGELKPGYISNATFIVLGKTANQFIFSNISVIQKSIKQQTGYTIIGILGLPLMRFMNMIIDISANTVNFK